MSRVIVVAGAGRSGTSTIAGALSMLGLHLPEPQVPADDTNPRGFYESQWVVDFHKALLRRTPVVRTLDSRPEAAELASTLATPDDAEELDEWLGEALGIVIWDPAVYYFTDVPSEVDPVHAAIVLSGGVISCAVGAIVPALRAAFMDPVKALRFE